MNCFIKSLIIATFGLYTLSAFASPKQLITHNMTDVESNAYIAGTIPSQHPTKPYTEGRVFWTLVRMACFGYIVDGKCSALIKMETDTLHPVDLGFVQVDIESGDITPKTLSAHGYTLVVNGPGETTLLKD